MDRPLTGGHLACSCTKWWLANRHLRLIMRTICSRQSLGMMFCIPFGYLKKLFRFWKVSVFECEWLERFFDCNNVSVFQVSWPKIQLNDWVAWMAKIQLESIHFSKVTFCIECIDQCDRDLMFFRFLDMDWELLEQRKVRPPFRPRVVSSHCNLQSLTFNSNISFFEFTEKCTWCRQFRHRVYSWRSSVDANTQRHCSLHQSRRVLWFLVREQRIRSRAQSFRLSSFDSTRGISVTLK